VTQNEAVLNSLKHRPRGMTALDAFVDLGVMRLAARVNELRTEGHRIDTGMVQVPKRDGSMTRVARYTLVVDTRYSLGGVVYD